LTLRGRLGDLEEGIRVSEKAVDCSSPDSPDLPILLNSLGIGVSDRYVRTGRLEDMEEAIRIYRRAVECTPPDSPELPENLNNLANGLSDRFARTGSPEDLEKTIRVYRRSVQCTPPDSPEVPRHLSNLANGLRSRFVHTRRLDDLEEAIRVRQQAVALTPANSPELPRHLNNLAAVLSARFACTGRLEHLEESIQISQQVVARTPPDSPELPMYLTSLGTGLNVRQRLSGRADDVEEARHAYQRACELGRDSNPAAVIISGRCWGDWASDRCAWEEAVTAYREALSVVDRLLRDQILRTDKESWLRDAQGMTERMAYALAKVGRAEDAVVALETGRARLLAEALEHSRRDLELLPQSGHTDLYQSYRNASETVQNLQQADRAAGAPSGSPLAVPAHADRHQAIQAARETLDAAIAGIRQVAEFEDFLVAPTWDHIQRTVTPETLLVYLVITSAGSLALIVRKDAGGSDASPQRKQEGCSEDGTCPDRPQSNSCTATDILWLDEFRKGDLNLLLVERSDGEVTGGYLPAQLERSDWLRASLDESLPLLGAKLLGPLAVALRSSLQVGPKGPARLGSGNAGEGTDQVPSGGRDLPHIVLIPTGRLSLLPLHAGRYVLDGRDVCFLDEFTVSYAISATALAKARQESRARSDTQLRLVGVGNPLPESSEAAEDRPGGLPFAQAELESIADMLPDGAACAFYEHNATRQSLLDALPGANLVHLSCHGRFRADDPLESGLLLADGELTLRDIIAAGFTALAATRLAVLSACQTAIHDFAKLPDEAIGLPAGLTQAGVPAVLGTLWSVNDASTALLMVRFYELLLQKHLPPPVALHLAQIWLRDATNAELDAYLSGHETIALARQSQSERMPLSAVHALLSQVLKGDPNERPYSHPYYWAPFVFYGAEDSL